MNPTATKLIGLLRKTPMVKVHAQDLADWQRRTRDIAASHHAKHHTAARWPYSWDRCPDETCYLLLILADQIGEELELFLFDEDDDES